MRIGFFNNMLDSDFIAEDAVREIQREVVDKVAQAGYSISHESAEALPIMSRYYDAIIVHPRTLPWSPHPSYILNLAPKPTLILSASKAKIEGLIMELGRHPHLRYNHRITPDSFINFLREVEGNPQSFTPSRKRERQSLLDILLQKIRTNSN